MNILRKLYKAITGPWFVPAPAVFEPTTKSEMEDFTDNCRSQGLLIAPKPESKNEALARIARQRSQLKDRIARAKASKKRFSHMQYQLEALTREELKVEGGR